MLPEQTKQTRGGRPRLKDVTATTVATQLCLPAASRSRYATCCHSCRSAEQLVPVAPPPVLALIRPDDRGAR